MSARNRASSSVPLGTPVPCTQRWLCLCCDNHIYGSRCRDSEGVQQVVYMEHYEGDFEAAFINDAGGVLAYEPISSAIFLLQMQGTCRLLLCSEFRPLSYKSTTTWHDLHTLSSVSHKRRHRLYDISPDSRKVPPSRMQQPEVDSEMASSATAKDDNPRSVKRVAVVGAGVSGLAAAYKLKSHGLDVTVFEADGRAGGRLKSVSRDGLVWDEGANTMIESGMEVTGLIDALGLQEKQQFPISQHKRYIVKNGTPLLVPTNPVALLQSKLLSAQSKIRIIFEPLMWKRSDSSKVCDEDSEESVSRFFERHFGKEVVEYLIDPFVGGTSAADPESLSVRHSFPELWNLEKRFGSIIAGALQSNLSAKRNKTGETKGAQRKNKPKRGSFSFQGGMQTLTDTLCKELGKDDLKLNAKVLTLAYSHDGSSSSQNWSITSTSNQNTQVVDAIIMTAPLCNVKDIKISKRGTPFPLNFLPEVTYLPLSVIISTFKKENVKRPLDGFGVLVPSKEQQNGFKTMGTLFSSMMFPDRAPSDLYLYTTFVGGTRNMELAQASTDELKKIVTSDLRKLLGAEGEPSFVNHFYWSKGFPLYGRNYGSVLEAIDKMEKDLPGLFYAGNHKGGLSVGKAIASGCKAADLVISYLNNASESIVPDK